MTSISTVEYFNKFLFYLYMIYDDRHYPSELKDFVYLVQSSHISCEHETEYFMMCVKSRGTEWFELKITGMILSFPTDRPGQTMQTQIRLLLEQTQIRLDRGAV